MALTVVAPLAQVVRSSARSWPDPAPRRARPIGFAVGCCARHLSCGTGSERGSPSRTNGSPDGAPGLSSFASASSSGGRRRSWRRGPSESCGQSCRTRMRTFPTIATSCAAPRSIPATFARSPICPGSRSAGRPTCAPTRRGACWRPICQPGVGRRAAPRDRPACRSGSSRTARRRRCGWAPTCSSGNGPTPRLAPPCSGSRDRPMRRRPRRRSRGCGPPPRVSPWASGRSACRTSSPTSPSCAAGSAGPSETAATRSGGFPRTSRESPRSCSSRERSSPRIPGSCSPTRRPCPSSTGARSSSRSAAGRRTTTRRGKCSTWRRRVRTIPSCST